MFNLEFGRHRINRRPGPPRRAWGVVLGLSVLLLSGCRLTPQVPLQAGVKEAPANVVFGRQHAPSPTPTQQFIAFANPNPLFPAPLAIAPPTVLPPPVPDPCPQAGPFVFPEIAASETPTKRPAEATYPYRFTMAVTAAAGTKDQKVTNTRGPGTKTISKTTAPGPLGDYEYLMETHFATYSTVFKYHVYPTAVGAGTLGGPTIAPGIYLVEVNDLAGNKFSPTTPGVEIMSLPAQPGQPVSGSGTDGSTATTMEVNPAQPPPPTNALPSPAPSAPPPPTAVKGSQVIDKANVDACGTVLQGWKVHDEGAIVDARNGPNASTFFNLDFIVGTEYGGFPLSMHLTELYTGSDGRQTIYDATDSINVTPLAPQAG
ncbi:MAG: hypothetical protein QOK05_678 [Chloroflexota bacterium]|jgi:hypothetical protein|nr:hypothetical protein [Chloroflexota bacterium]